MPISFSIVIPTYNREKLIERTLNSVLAQTYPHYEIIVVDNCSTDKTEQVLQPFIEAKQIRFIKHDQNYERARSRNTGMENATGDFLTFLDSDDLMYETNLADAADFIKANQDIKCFHNLYELVDKTGQVIYRYKFPPLKNRLKAIVTANFMSCIGNFISREIYQNYKFDTFPELTGGEDWEFWLRVLADYEVGRIEKVNSGVVHHTSRSVNNQNIISMQKGLNYLSNKFAEDRHLSKIYAPYLKRIESNSCVYLATLCITGELYDEAKKHLRTALKKDVRIIGTSRFASILRRSVFRIPVKIE